MSDHDMSTLLQKLESGDADNGWAEFLEQYSNQIFAVVRCFESDADDVSDCFQYVCEQLVADGFVRARVDLLRSLMARNHSEEWKLPAEKLYDLLIAPVEDAGWLRGVERLYLVPHAVLHYVPCAALRQKVNGRENLLVEKYGLEYLPAAALLLNVSNSAGNNKSMLALAPENAGLQLTEQESRSVSNFFPETTHSAVGNPRD